MLETELLGPYLVEVWRGERERVEELLQRPGVHVPAGMRVILGSARGMVYDKVRDGYEHISGLDKHSDVANFIARTAQEEDADDGDAGVQEAPSGVAPSLGGPEPTPASPPFFVEMLGWGADSRVHIRRTPSTTITALPSVLRFLESDFHHGSVNGTSRPALIIVSDWYLADPDRQAECILAQCEALLEERARVVTREVLAQWEAERAPYDWRWIREPGSWMYDDWEETQSAKGELEEILGRRTQTTHQASRRVVLRRPPSCPPSCQGSGGTSRAGGRRRCGWTGEAP